MSTARRIMLCLSSLTLMCAQTPAPQNQAEIESHEAPVTFSSRVNLVSVPVVVRDRDGHAVGNLRQEDFQLFDKSKVQTISRFTMEVNAPPDPKSPDAPKPAAAPGAAPAETPKPVLPTRFVAYLFDDIHTTAGDLLNGRKAANEQLDHTLDANTRAAVFTTSARTTQDFTSDAAKLHAAVNRVQPWERGQDKHQDCPTVSYFLADLLINQEQVLSPGLSDDTIQNFLANGDPALNAVYSEAEACLHTTNLQEVTPQVRAAAQLALAFGKEETMSGLSVVRDLIRGMSSLPGNRSVVMVSPGFLLSTEHRVFENDILDKAIHANVTINTLDVRGLSGIPGMEASEAGYQGNSAAFMMQADINAASQSQDLLAELASGTGGTFFHNSNSLEQGLEQLAAQPEYLYVLGFSPDNLKMDGSYHGLKVTVKSPNVKIDARRGYWAPNHAIGVEEEAREEIQDAVFSRQDLADIPVKMHTEFFKQSDTKAELTVETRISLQGLKFRKADDRNRDILTVVTGVFDQNGRYIKGIERTMDMKLRDTTLEAARNAPLTVKESFDLAPGVYVVRVVVRDTEGRSMSAQNEGVEIP